MAQGNARRLVLGKITGNRKILLMEEGEKQIYREFSVVKFKQSDDVRVRSFRDVFINPAILPMFPVGSLILLEGEESVVNAKERKLNADSCMLLLKNRTMVTTNFLGIDDDNPVTPIEHEEALGLPCLALIRPITKISNKTYTCEVLGYSCISADDQEAELYAIPPLTLEFPQDGSHSVQDQLFIIRTDTLGEVVSESWSISTDDKLYTSIDVKTKVVENFQTQIHESAYWTTY